MPMPTTTRPPCTSTRTPGTEVVVSGPTRREPTVRENAVPIACTPCTPVAAVAAARAIPSTRARSAERGEAGLAAVAVGGCVAVLASVTVVLLGARGALLGALEEEEAIGARFVTGSSGLPAGAPLGDGEGAAHRER